MAIMRLFDRTIDAMAVAGGIILAFITLLIIVDVSARSLGLFVVDWSVAVTEYAMLYVTALAAPWLLRERGHVYIEILRARMPDPVNRVFARMVYALGLGFSLVFVGFSIPVIYDSWNEFDTRAFDVPRWLLFLPLAVCFAFIAVEFARYLFGGRSYYEAGHIIDEGF
jgi:TRAP-type C4-dicarboxylate transport system permease small subunit